MHEVSIEEGQHMHLHTPEVSNINFSYSFLDTHVPNKKEILVHKIFIVMYDEFKMVPEQDNNDKCQKLKASNLNVYVWKTMNCEINNLDYWK